MIYSKISDISSYFPQKILSNEELSNLFPEWDISKIESKTGIKERRITEEGETALNLGVCAAQKIIDKNEDLKNEIDGLLFCTQSPDYCIPPNACMTQKILGLRQDIPATDYNLGCSGFVFGLSLAHGWISSGICKKVLLITAETYSKYIADKDKSIRTIFGDGASATLVEATNKKKIYEFSFVTDGSGAMDLIVPSSRIVKNKYSISDFPQFFEYGRTLNNIYMDGPRVFQFTLRCVPNLLEKCLSKNKMLTDDIDFYVFHQANAFMLEHIRIKCKIPNDKFIIDFEDIGNTVSCTIPIALKRSIEKKIIKKGQTVFIAGFGVGYSAAATIIKI